LFFVNLVITDKIENVNTKFKKIIKISIKRKIIKIKELKNQTISRPDKRYRPNPFRTSYPHKHKKKITKCRRS